MDLYPDPTCPDVLLVHGEKTEWTMEYSAPSLQVDEEFNEPPHKRPRRDQVGVRADDSAPQTATVQKAGTGPNPENRPTCMSNTKESQFVNVPEAGLVHSVFSP